MVRSRKSGSGVGGGGDNFLLSNWVFVHVILDQKRFEKQGVEEVANLLIFWSSQSLLIDYCIRILYFGTASK